MDRAGFQLESDYSCRVTGREAVAEFSLAPPGFVSNTYMCIDTILSVSVSVGMFVGSFVNMYLILFLAREGSSTSSCPRTVSRRGI